MLWCKASKVMGFFVRAYRVASRRVLLVGQLKLLDVCLGKASIAPHIVYTKKHAVCSIPRRQRLQSRYALRCNARRAPRLPLAFHVVCTKQSKLLCTRRYPRYALQTCAQLSCWLSTWARGAYT